MFIGFDYGTANCSVAKIEQGIPQLLKLEGDSVYIPSTLSAPTREAVAEYLFKYRDIKPLDSVGEQVLRRAINLNREEGVEFIADEVAFGQAALDHYLQDPSESYYVKSPKSFLGASGLRDVQVSFFEDLVCAMMDNIKRNAEQDAGQIISDTVIGRPVNFHGRDSAAANRQAEEILRKAATRAGFKNIEFQFEPVAAGLEYEASLTENKTVLVVDIGGGTTDCSLIEMGPHWRGKSDRSQSLLAHSGQRIGGNDLDIALAFKQLMTPFGLGSKTIADIVMPTIQFWNPIAINSVDAQADFYSRSNLATLKQLHKDAKEPEKLLRLIEVFNETLGYRIVRQAEEAKIALSEQPNYRAAMQLLSEQLEVEISFDDMTIAIETPKQKMAELVKEAVVQGGVKPDAIFMTGGSARSPILRNAVQQTLPDIEVVSGNYFGSVTAGLARWAEVCFK